MPEVIARPTATKEMIMAAAEVVAARIDAEAASIAEHYRHPMDGYQLAKELDMYGGWDTTRDDMEALEEVERLVSEAVANAEQQWLAENEIRPPYPIGTRLLCHRDKKPGTITDIYKYSAAAYEVKPDGQDDESSGECRWIIKFEDAVAA